MIKTLALLISIASITHANAMKIKDEENPNFVDLVQEQEQDKKNKKIKKIHINQFQIPSEYRSKAAFDIQEATPKSIAKQFGLSKKSLDEFDTSVFCYHNQGETVKPETFSKDSTVLLIMVIKGKTGSHRMQAIDLYAQIKDIINYEDLRNLGYSRYDVELTPVKKVKKFFKKL